MIDVGQKCKGIIVKKDDAHKELWIHLTKLIMFDAESKYLISERSGAKRK